MPTTLSQLCVVKGVLSVKIYPFIPFQTVANWKTICLSTTQFFNLIFIRRLVVVCVF